jgi:sterol desaturase/sphingolipid hydroxylase (fatty acid hydroxylase superfamily)
MDQIAHVGLSAAHSLADAIVGLLWPALFFLGVGLVRRGRMLLDDMHRSFAETRLNLKIVAFNAVLVAPGLAVASDVMSRTIAGGALEAGFWADLPPLVTIGLAVFIGDFVGYWRHRLEHTKLLWPSHAVHHSDTEMTWLTLERFHPVNRLSTSIIDTAILLLLGVPPLGLIANNLVRHYYGYLIHADLPWTYGGLGAIFVSPAMHRWHHAADEQFFRANFATVFSIFDRAFGTYRVPGPCGARLGVTDDVPPTLAGQIGYAFMPNTYRGLFATRRPAPSPAAFD